jgi:hypothetical protein
LSAAPVYRFFVATGDARAKDAKQIPSFYLHEIYESTLMNRGVLYEVAHPAALNRYGVSAFSVYHLDVILTTPGFNEHWMDFWREMARRGVNP